MKALPILSVFTALSALLIAQPENKTIPVNEVLAEVVRANPELPYYEAELTAAQAFRRGAGAWSDPSLGVEVGHKRVRDAAGVLAGEGTAWTVSISQTFEWPGRLALRKSLANGQVDLAELGLAAFKAELAARARLAIVELQAAEARSQATAEVAARYRALREVFVSRDPAGLTPVLETRVIEAQEIALKRRASEAHLAAQRARTELNQLRGRPPEADLALPALPVVTFRAAPDTSALLTEAREHNFLYRSRQRELAQQGLEVSLARKDRYGSVTVAPYVSRERAGDRETTAGISLSLPLPLSQRSRSAVDVAEVRRRQAETLVLVAERELQTTVANASAAYATHVSALGTWQPNALEEFAKAAELADRHFRLGAVPLSTYVELQNAYLDAVESLVETRHDALAAAAQLEQLVGRSLDLMEESK